MKTVVFTSNSIRHKYFANSISCLADDVLVISECVNNDATDYENLTASDPIHQHFRLRYETEKRFFQGNDFLITKTLPIIYKEVNLKYVYDVVKKFEPELALVFGSSIIKEHVLSLPTIKYFLNLHLGLSPYYRGSGTNFWPFVNNEIEYVGSTILYIDSGIDTGDILTHIRPNIESGDDVHSVGCKVIKESTLTFIKIFDMIKAGKKLPRVKQWNIDNERYYENKDFTSEILALYKKNLANHIVENYVSSPKPEINLVRL